jgi:transcription initiation factor TFIIB
MVKDSEDYDDKLSEIDPRLKAEILEMQECPKCDSIRLMRDYECIEIVCMDCGFVVNQKNVDTGSESKAFNEAQKSKRVRAGTSLTFTIHDKGLTRVVDWHNRDSSGKNVLVSQKAQGYRLHKWQRRIRVTGSTERNLTFALSEIAKTANKLDLSKNVLETASVIYQKAIKEQLINGRSIRGIAAASLYLACRQCGLARTIDELAHASAVNKKELGKNYRFLIKKLDCSIPPLQPNQCIAKFSNKVTTQRIVEEISHKILTAAKDSKLTAGRSPTGIAAAASYIALVLINEHKTQKEIADIVQTTEITIKTRYKELVDRLMFEISL